MMVKGLVKKLRSIDDRDLSLLMPSMRVMMAGPNWLSNKKEITGKFQEAAQQTSGLPSISFPAGVPVFLKTVEASRMTKTQYGEREIAVIEVIEPPTMPDNPPGTRLTMWITQEVLRTKMENFRGPDGKIPANLELCVVNLGKVKGQKFAYNDYFIGTAEAGMKIVKELMP